MEILKDQPIAAIADLQKAFFRAVQEKNLSFTKENIHEGFIFTSPRAIVLNKESFINNFVLNSDLLFDIFQSSDEQVVIAGNAGLVNCLVQVKLADQADFWERVTFALVNERSKWLILSMHATFIS
jgi:hypothetical protein